MTCSKTAGVPIRIYCVPLCGLTGLFTGEGQERDVPAALDRHGDLALMTGAIAGDAAGKDLAPFGDEELQGLEVLVVDERCLVDAEPADLFSDLEPLLAAWAGSRVPGPAALGRAGPGRSKSRRPG